MIRLRGGVVAALLAAGTAAAAVAAGPDAAAGRSKAEPCGTCHGADGNPTNPQCPSLAAQTPLYIYYQLVQFRERRRVNELMSPLAAKLSDADMKDIAAWYSGQQPKEPEAASDGAGSEAGRTVAAANHCGSCHTPTYAGQKHIPRIAGLKYEYLVAQLRGFKTGERPDIDGSMASAAQPLTDKDIADVSHYLAGLH